MVVGGRPPQFDLSRFDFGQQQFQDGRSRVDDHFQARLDVVPLRVQPVETVERADREPVFTVRRSHVIEVVAPRFGLVDHPPARPLVGGDIKLHLPGVEALHLRRVGAERNAEVHLIGEDGIRPAVAGRDGPSRRQQREHAQPGPSPLHRRDPSTPTRSVASYHPGTTNIPPDASRPICRIGRIKRTT